MSRKIHLKEVVRYACMPGIIPRVRELFSVGFSILSAMMACVFSMVRLLPKDHPYLATQNYGRYGVMQVIVAAADHIVFSRRNIDQIIVFAVVVISLTLMMCQVGLLAFQGVVGLAHAAGTTQWSGSLFVTHNPERDVAFMLLDQVFAIPEFFGSSLAPATVADIGVLPRAIQAMFAFYSWGIMYLCLLLLVYYAIVFVLEGAKDGVPFGKRFASLYAPIRFMIAMLLLLPLGYGYNTGQYIVLHTAKIGSSFATNGWLGFNQMGGGYNPVGGEPSSISAGHSTVMKFNVEFPAHLMEFVHLVATCRLQYEAKHRGKSYEDNYRHQPWEVPKDPDAHIKAYYYNPQATIGPKFVEVAEIPLVAGAVDAMFEDALEFFQGGDIRIRFGHLTDGNDVGKECGELVVPNKMASGGYPPETLKSFEREITFRQWWFFQIYFMIDPYPYYYAGRVYEMRKQSGGQPCLVPAPAAAPFAGDSELGGYGWNNPVDPCMATPSVRSFPPGLFLNEYVDTARVTWDAGFSLIWDNALSMNIEDEVLFLGWAGAGVWFNRIAEVNGSLAVATNSMPAASLYPAVMEKVKAKTGASGVMISMEDQFLPTVPAEGKHYLKVTEQKWAETLNFVYSEFRSDKKLEGERASSTNWMEKFTYMVFGMNGLADIKGSHGTHPLALMTGMGNNMINRSITHMASAMAASAAGGYIGVTKDKKSQLTAQSLKSLSTMFATLFSITILTGFFMAYMIPFLPFMYTFFAVGRWVKGIFEAMVAVPLWALAHMKIDGDGIPGPFALQGYMLVFEIFLRPILTIFGLVCSVVFFSAFMDGLHSVFWLVVSNAGGSGDDATWGGGKMAQYIVAARRGVDELFYMIMYAILAYIIALANFKLIDQIPESILRWANVQAKAFADGGDDPTSSMTATMGYMGSQIAGTGAQAATGAAREGGDLVGRAVNAGEMAAPTNPQGLASSAMNRGVEGIRKGVDGYNKN